MFDKLKQQQEKVIKPMLLEIKVQNAIIDRLKKDCQLNERDLKRLSAMMKLPRMANYFHQALRRRYEKEQQQSLEKEAT